MEEQAGDASNDGGDDSEDPTQVPVTNEWLFGVPHGINISFLLLLQRLLLLSATFSSVCAGFADMFASLHLAVTCFVDTLRLLLLLLSERYKYDPCFHCRWRRFGRNMGFEKTSWNAYRMRCSTAFPSSFYPRMSGLQMNSWPSVSALLYSGSQPYNSNSMRAGIVQ